MNGWAGRSAAASSTIHCSRLCSLYNAVRFFTEKPCRTTGFAVLLTLLTLTETETETDTMSELVASKTPLEFTRTYMAAIDEFYAEWKENRPLMKLFPIEGQLERVKTEGIPAEDPSERDIAFLDAVDELYTDWKMDNPNSRLPDWEAAIVRAREEGLVPLTA